MKILVEPLWDNILVRRLKEENADEFWGVTSDGERSLLIKPLSAQRKEVESQGLVVALGPECKSGLQVGDHIVFPQFAGQDQELAGVDHITLCEREVKSRLRRVDEEKERRFAEALEKAML